MGARRRLVEAHRDEIADVARRHRASSIRLFGSAARDEDTERSDLDFLVEFEDGSSLFDLMHLRDDLEELLGCTVDVVSIGGLTARDEHILAEAIPL
jgi:predicted nucleotidyltransferase